MELCYHPQQSTQQPPSIRRGLGRAHLASHGFKKQQQPPTYVNFTESFWWIFNLYRPAVSLVIQKTRFVSQVIHYFTDIFNRIIDLVLEFQCSNNIFQTKRSAELFSECQNDFPIRRYESLKFSTVTLFPLFPHFWWIGMAV